MAFHLPKLFSLIKIPRCLSSNRVCVNRVNRNIYGRMYPVYLALPNGATIRIRYKEPRRLLQLPFNLDECDEEERIRRLLRRKPKARLELQDELCFEDSFDETAYDFLWSKPKPK